MPEPANLDALPSAEAVTVLWDEVERLRRVIEERTAALGEEIQRRAASEGEHQVTQERLAQARRELTAAHVRAETAVRRRNDVKAERDALKVAIERVEADAVKQQRETGTTADSWLLGVYAQASRTRSILRDALAVTVSGR